MIPTDTFFSQARIVHLDWSIVGRYLYHQAPVHRPVHCPVTRAISAIISVFCSASLPSETYTGPGMKVNARGTVIKEIKIGYQQVKAISEILINYYELIRYHSPVTDTISLPGLRYAVNISFYI